GRRAGEPRQHDTERARADRVGVRDELRLRDHDALDVLRRQALRRRLAIQLLPYDVAGREELRLLRQRHGRLALLLHGGGGGERVRERREPPVAQLDRVQHVLVRRAERARRADLLCLRERLLLLVCVLLQLALEIGDLRRRAELVRELAAERRVGIGDRLHARRIRLVLVVLRAALAR